MKPCIALLICTTVLGCASQPSTPPAAHSTPPSPPAASEQANAAPQPADAAAPAASSNRDVIAIVDGRPVVWSALQSSLLEASGGVVLAEWVLERKIQQALAARNVTITQQEVDAERANLLETLADDRNEAARLLTQLREQRGLGPQRFEALLRRNAGLRKLVAGEVKVSEPMVREAWEGRYGERTEVRMILTTNLPEATAALRRARAGESFTDLAIALSRDSSRNQGGLLPPISTQDATFPKAIRDAAAKLQPGEISDPIALDAGFAILRCERKIKAEDVPLATVADDLRRRVRLALERTAMQREARVLMESAEVTAFDASLSETWKRQRQQMLDNSR